VFGIEWLREGRVVEKETSVLTTQSEVIASARERAPEVVARLRGREPDSFRLRSANHAQLGTYPLRGGR
jgi:hypothetical protein